jgi:predicted double-glycine peptidase
MIVLAGAITIGGCTAQLSEATSRRFLVGGTPVGDYAMPVASLTERRFTGVIRQKYDFSCGSAALATLLRHHYDYKVAEDNAFRGMWAQGDRESIRRAGFSLLDMKRWLASRGIVANGYKVSLDKIGEAGVPGIALIAVKNYRHFVVVKGLRSGEVLLGDPSVGVVAMPRDTFLSAWNGVYFVLTSERERAKASFNRAEQWQAYTRAPIGRDFSEPLSQQALALTAPFQGDF